jgi:hypothetical protein
MDLSCRVTGGTKVQKHIAYTTIGFCVRKLFPSIRKLDLNICIKKFKADDDAIGYCQVDTCEPFDYVRTSPRRFKVEISKALDLMSFIRVLCHEMVHVKQFIKEELTDTDSGQSKWKSKVYSHNTPYMDCPWEKEAYKQEDALLWECLLTTQINISGESKE